MAAKEDSKDIWIPLGVVYDKRKSRRAADAVKYVRKFLEKRLKKPVKVDKSVNEMLWARGIQKPPRRIKVTVTSEEDKTVASLSGK
ncbi:MAG: 50S ribosomal protein L31e [Candidatus Altiarchaeota archaeon]